jgi:hypothetical protein
MSSAWSVLNNAEAFLQQWGVVVGATAVILIVVWYYTTPKTIPGEGKMKREEYEKVRLSGRNHKRKLNSLIADKITDGLLDLYANGDMTDEDYKSWNLRLSKHFKDLALKKLTQPQLKAALKRRHSNGVNKPVKLPTVKEVYKPKNVIDKVLHPHFT